MKTHTGEINTRCAQVELLQRRARKSCCQELKSIVLVPQLDGVLVPQLDGVVHGDESSAPLLDPSSHSGDWLPQLKPSVPADAWSSAGEFFHLCEMAHHAFHLNFEVTQPSQCCLDLRHPAGNLLLLRCSACRVIRLRSSFACWELARTRDISSLSCCRLPPMAPL